jgi:hypothetical protein
MATTVTIDDTTVTGSGTAPDAPTGLNAETEWDGVRLYWVNPSNRDLDYIEIYRSATNDRATATKVAEIKGNNYLDHDIDTSPGARYYWIRSRSTTGLPSTSYEPAGATAGVVGTPDAVNLTSVAAGQVLYFDGSQWINTGAVTLSGINSASVVRRNSTGATGGNLIAVVRKERTDGARTDGQGAWLAFRYNGLESSVSTGYNYAAVQSRYFASGAHQIRLATTTDTAGNFTTQDTVLESDRNRTTILGALTIKKSTVAGLSSLTPAAGDMVQISNSTPAYRLAYYTGSVWNYVSDDSAV